MFVWSMARVLPCLVLPNYRKHCILETIMEQLEGEASPREQQSSLAVTVISATENHIWVKWKLPVDIKSARRRTVCIGSPPSLIERLVQIPLSKRRRRNCKFSVDLLTCENVFVLHCHVCQCCPVQHLKFDGQVEVDHKQE